MNAGTNKFKSKELPLIIALLLSPISHQQALADGITDIGVLPNGTDSIAFGVSGDGSVVVGYSTTGGNAHAFSYQNGVMTDLGFLQNGVISYAKAASNDGSVIVGSSSYINNSNLYQAFKYVMTNGGPLMTGLGFLANGDESVAGGVSSNGVVIAGYSNLTAGGSNYHAFKYVNGIISDLGTIDNNNSASDSKAYGVSSDGLVIVGASTPDGNSTNQRAFKYSNGQMTDLGVLNGRGDTNSAAFAVSANGQVVVGYSGHTGDNHAIKYENGTMTDLGSLGGNLSVARAASANGAVIVGESNLTSGGSYHAFKYFKGAMTDLGTLGGNSSNAYGVSADGSVIVGYSNTAQNVRHAFLYRNSMLDVDNTYTALAQNASQLNSVLNLQSNLLNAGLSYDCANFSANNLCVAVGGSYSSNSNQHSAQSAANLRAAYQLTPSVRIGAFVDQAISNSTPNNFNLKNNMPLIGAFAAWSQNSDGLGASVRASVAYNHRDMDITRTKLDNTEAGTGSASLTTKGIQLEGAWGVALNDHWTAQPFAGVRFTNIKRSAFAENGVDFPVSYDKATLSGTTGYVGARFNGVMSDKLSSHLSIGIEQDLSRHLSNNSGAIETLGSFNLSAPSIRETRGFVMGGLNYKVNQVSSINAGVSLNQDALNHAVGVTAMANYMIGF